MMPKGEAFWTADVNISSKMSPCTQADSRNSTLGVVYKNCYACLLDYKRKFLEAGQRYYELSYNTQVVVEDRLNTLECTVICTVLAAAGGANA